LRRIRFWPLWRSTPSRPQKNANDNRANQRQRTIINRLLSGFEGFLTTSKYSRLAKCSNDTALRDVNELVARGILLKNAARGRGTSYRLAEPEAIVR
jgi:Fic family protein